MKIWLLILIIRSNSVAAIQTTYVESYKSCKEAGERFEAITKDSRFLCVPSEQTTN